jgi:hypothetical protein
MIQKKVIIAIFVCNSFLALSQPYFKVTNYQSNYTNLGQPFPIFADKYWDVFTGQCAYLPLPFTYSFVGVSYSNVCISKSGLITFYHPQSFLANRIFGLHTRYKERNSTAPFISSINTQTEFIDGQNVFKVEYRNAGFYQSTNPDLYANFQIWLYERTGVFEVHFGDINADTSAWLPSSSNTKGPYCGISLNEDRLFVLLGGSSDNPTWLVHNDTFLLDVPKANLVYRFTPVTTGLDAEPSDIDAFNVYPNPTTSGININPHYNYSYYDYVVTDIFGRELLRENNLNGEVNIPHSRLNAGLVFVTVTLHNGSKFTRKITVN